VTSLNYRRCATLVI